VGGAGADSFAFGAEISSGLADRILDFVVADDTIRLSAAAVGLAAGPLDPSALAIVASGKNALDAADRIIYNQTNGGLFFDPDGAGGAVSIYFAQLAPGLALTAGDVLLI
jgi:serralysin